MWHGFTSFFNAGARMKTPPLETGSSRRHVDLSIMALVTKVPQPDSASNDFASQSQRTDEIGR
jgi:hypothetical protein